MKSAREDILGRIRSGLSANRSVATPDAVRARLEGRETGIRLDRGHLDVRRTRIDQFVEKARGVDCTVRFAKGFHELPEAVSDYLRHRNLPAMLVAAPHADLDEIDWNANAISVRCGAPAASDLVGINRAFGGVAETGTLVMLSGSDSPSTINFLPENHITVLRESEVCALYEDVWDRLHSEGRSSGRALPRTVNLITGISRTGDIEQTIQTGVHGPRYLHIIIIRDA